MRLKSKTVMDQMNADKPDDVLADLEAKHGSSAPTGSVFRYANSPNAPKHRDIVEWVSNGERWTVDAKDDLTGPSALHHWPDGGWCNVRVIQRCSKPGCGYPDGRPCIGCGLIVTPNND